MVPHCVSYVCFKSWLTLYAGAVAEWFYPTQMCQEPAGFLTALLKFTETKQPQAGKTASLLLDCTEYQAWGASKDQQSPPCPGARQHKGAVHAGGWTHLSSWTPPKVSEPIWSPQVSHLAHLPTILAMKNQHRLHKAQARTKMKSNASKLFQKCKH